MTQEKNILAIIPARGGSKRLPHKNTLLLAGKPLIAHSIEQAKKSSYINKVVVSTDSEEIAEVAHDWDADIIMRPDELAGDTSPVLLALQHTVQQLEKEKRYRADIIVLLQATSPLREVADIDQSIKKLLEEQADSVETFCAVKEHPAAMFKIDEKGRAQAIDPKNLPKRSQDLPKLYVENGAAYVFTKKLLDQDKLYGKKHFGQIMPRERSIDIDEEIDFKIAEMILEERQ